jgi:hypothetical protein
VSVIAYGFCLKMPIYEVRKRDIICIVNDPFETAFAAI